MNNLISYEYESRRAAPRRVTLATPKLPRGVRGSPAVVVGSARPSRKGAAVVGRIVAPSPTPIPNDVLPHGAGLRDTDSGLLLVGRESPKPVTVADKEFALLPRPHSTSVDFMEFPPPIVAELLAESEAKGGLLAVGSQFGNFVSFLMEKAGYPRAEETNQFIRTYLQSPEETNWKQSLTHPLAKERAPYDNLALLFMAKLWNRYGVGQKRGLLRALLILFEYTVNPEDIKAGRLMIRLGEILEDTEDKRQRELIYALMEIVNGKGGLPKAARSALIRTIERHREYGASVVLSFLMDERWKEAEDAKFRQGYSDYLAGTLGKLSCSIEELDRLSPAEWMKLCNEVLALNLITYGQPEGENRGKVGIEIELVPATKGTEEALRDRKKRLGLDGDSMSRDGNCVELRTGKGGVEIGPLVIYAMYEALREEAGRNRSVVASMHVHIDRTACSADKMRKLFGSIKTDTEHLTHEVRGISHPALRVEGQKRLNTVDVLQIESATLTCCAADKLEDNGRPVEVAGLPPKYAYLKVIIGSLGEGSTSMQRAALIRTLFNSKCFLNEQMVQELIVRTDRRWRLTEYMMKNIYYEFAVRGLLLGMMEQRGEALTAGITLAREVVPRMKDEECLVKLLLRMMELGGEALTAGIALAREVVPRMKDEERLGYLLLGMMELGGEALTAGIALAREVVPRMKDEGPLGYLLVRMMELGGEALTAGIALAREVVPRMKDGMLLKHRLLEMMRLRGEALTAGIALAREVVPRMKDEEHLGYLLIEMMKLGGEALTAGITLAREVVPRMKDGMLLKHRLLEMMRLRGEALTAGIVAK
jgi:hypothetical protein